MTIELLVEVDRRLEVAKAHVARLESIQGMLQGGDCVMNMLPGNTVVGPGKAILELAVILHPDSFGYDEIISWLGWKRGRSQKWALALLKQGYLIRVDNGGGRGGNGKNSRYCLANQPRG